jgi:hypothetical protein
MFNLKKHQYLQSCCHRIPCHAVQKVVPVDQRIHSFSPVLENYRRSHPDTFHMALQLDNLLFSGNDNKRSLLLLLHLINSGEEFSLVGLHYMLDRCEREDVQQILDNFPDCICPAQVPILSFPMASRNDLSQWNQQPRG